MRPPTPVTNPEISSKCCVAFEYSDVSVMLMPSDVAAASKEKGSEASADGMSNVICQTPTGSSEKFSTFITVSSLVFT